MTPKEQAVRYADVLPDSPLADVAPLIVLAVPTLARNYTATAAVVDTNAPIKIAVWSATSTTSPLAILLDRRK